MQIAGLEKLSLIDYPGKIACSIFLFGCNFRCGFCYNPGLVLLEKPEKIYSENEVLEFLEKRKKYLEGVCITGGEPLINNDIIDFLKKIKELGYEIKIDTNGSNPELLKKIIDNKLIDYIAIDVKSDKKNYDKITGIKMDIKKIEESLEVIKNSGIDYEIRTTILNGINLEELGKWINRLIGKPKKYVIQNFNSKNKLIDSRLQNQREFSKEELEEFKESIKKYFEKVEIRA